MNYGDRPVYAIFHGFLCTNIKRVHGGENTRAFVLKGLYPITFQFFANYFLKVAETLGEIEQNYGEMKSFVLLGQSVEERVETWGCLRKKMFGLIETRFRFYTFLARHIVFHLSPSQSLPFKT